MEYAVFYSLGLLALTAIALIFRSSLATYAWMRGPRVLTCPKSGVPATVEVDAWRAALTVESGELQLRLRSCSRWPENQGCGQECLRQVEPAAHRTPVRR
jgi:hypothetical protein